MAERHVRVVGVGPGGADQVTLEALAALRACDYLVVADKPQRGGAPDPLVEARERLLDRHLGDARPPLVRVVDPPRDRTARGTATPADYERAVEAWHDARAAAYAEAIAAHAGDPGFLVWGDPAFYDSTIRVLERVAAQLPLRVTVVPGVSSVQLLAARHGLVLHDVGRPVHVTTGRAVLAAVDAGQTNLVVMLNRDLAPLADLRVADWQVWWGGNLGTASERLVAGRVGDVLDALDRARVACREETGWVMDAFVLRAPVPALS
ncbi:precorrin-6A synthase (deacetylating) [Nocardioides perillae]|uniref:Precorrin-6A synthase n=1 Tax=Nocardioides perillae TaxID=1119534 RepID=A0A7Y9RV65_9ACTN|nr:precorrin-6A synthase [Nocardioides perillae]